MHQGWWTNLCLYWEWCKFGAFFFKINCNFKNASITNLSSQKQKRQYNERNSACEPGSYEITYPTH